MPKQKSQQFLWRKVPGEIKTPDPELLANCLLKLFEFKDDILRYEDDTSKDVVLIYQGNFEIKLIEAPSRIDSPEICVYTFTFNQEDLSSFASDLPVELIWVKKGVLDVCCPIASMLICRFRFDLFGL